MIAQSVKALENKEAFKPLVEDYDQKKSRVLQLHALKTQANLFVSECVNLKDKVHSIGVLKKLQLDRAAQTAQNRKDEEEQEGHVVPNGLKALPGISCKHPQPCNLSCKHSQLCNLSCKHPQPCSLSCKHSQLCNLSCKYSKLVL